ncbi:GmrSD restriction endonuclease domain-containing protein [Dietzia massiliensis]|uniref:GmrSD restriction endonuclease domain-containing protein n=1 Tax=Dietzia massiliensis TaxID=2697499 RepID=UPI001BCD7273|nr:DUF262 domain-containing protein [Dietzia massiliensis]MBS7547015.1 DUF262 domain-containing protein [Dietzia massiliensis]
MGFQTPQHALPDLLKRIDSGDIQLPDFQRGYRWDSERVRSLVLTVIRGYPLGAVMTMSAANQDVYFKPRTFAGTPPGAASAAPTELVLDGQQRLTSLYQALHGDGVVEIVDPNDEDKTSTVRFFIDMNKVGTDADLPDDAVFATPADGVIRTNFNRDVVQDLSTQVKQIEARAFPVNQLLGTGGFSWLLDLDDRDLQQRFNAAVIVPVSSYKIPAITLDADTTRGAVTTVFEKVNTGGMPLDVFELLTATYAGDRAYQDEHGIDFRLRDDWALTEEVIDAHPVLAGFDKAKFLQAVTLLASHEGTRPTTARRDDILRLPLADYVGAAGRIRNSLAWVASFLRREYIYTADDLPYPTQIVPLAAIHAVLGDAVGTHAAAARLRQWFWCGVLGELYSSTTETRFARDVDQVVAWVTDGSGPAPITIADAGFYRSRLLSVRTRNSAAYKGIYALLMADQSKDWILDQTFTHTMYDEKNVDIHHVFPKKWCTDRGIEPGVYNSILNKTPLAASTNRSIGGLPPSVYLGTVAKGSGLSDEQVDTIVAGHQIDPALLRADNFVEFYRDRTKRLSALVEAAMGKKSVDDIDPEFFEMILRKE